MKVESVHFECGVCGLGTGVVENDIADPDLDTEAPPGWLVAITRVVMPNPDHVAAPDADEVLAGMLAGTPVAQHAAVAPMLRVQAEAVVNAFEEAPAHVVVDAIVVLCPDHRGQLITLDVEAFEDTPLAVVVAQPVQDAQ